MAKKHVKKSKKKTVKKVTKKVAKKATAKKATKKATSNTSAVWAAKPMIVDDLQSALQNIEKHLVSIENRLILNAGGPPPLTTEVVQESATSVPKEERDLFGAPATAATTNNGTTWTADEIKTALQDVLNIEGEDKVRSILSDFKAKRTSDLKETDFPQIMALCNAITGVSKKTQAPANDATSFL